MKYYEREPIPIISTPTLKYYYLRDELLSPIGILLEYNNKSSYLKVREYVRILNYIVKELEIFHEFRIIDYNLKKGEIFFEYVENITSVKEELENYKNFEKKYNLVSKIIEKWWLIINLVDPEDYVLGNFEDIFFEDIFLSFVNIFLKKILKIDVDSKIYIESEDIFINHFKEITKIKTRFNLGGLTFNNVVKANNNIVIINFNKAAKLPFIYDLAVFISQVSIQIDPIFELIFIRDIYRLSQKEGLIKNDLTLDEFTTIYKILELHYLLHSLIVNYNDNIHQFKYNLKIIYEHTKNYPEILPLWNFINRISNYSLL